MEDNLEGTEEVPIGVVEMENGTETETEAVEGTSVETEMETENDVKGGGGKRRSGRNSKAPARKTNEEEVCFVCFDGGELVLCDRRGCNKAYHPACVDRDEAFFRTKGRWNCGWHVCSNCQKTAHYMCYTCTFSLCKRCIKDAVILCVRGNKGFCETCMKMVTLIENNEQENKEAQVDFEDESSWEYLFKDYWIQLKAKLSLSSVEVSQAKNPWKGSDVSAGKQESPDEPFDVNEDGGSGSDSYSEKLETSRSKRRKARKRSKSITKEEDITSEVAVGAEEISTPRSTEWASKELLEFVMHMKDGDGSAISQFDVQALLLEYIKINKLRDPRRKSQIICDARLQNLFGKARVGHFEMLKLLESHFLIKDESQIDDIQGSVVDTDINHLDSDSEALTKGGKDKKRKQRKKGDGRGPQSNLDDYAAIDIHNITLIFLRRKLMEDLLEDSEKFHDKVVGTFVRIRISGSNQKQDIYRLVQVVGTSKADEPYKVGKRTTDIMLEILNLNKTEVISIDTISNQEFTQDECKRLRQSIKCGLITRLTVGGILDKVIEIQGARVNDWLETEIVRLSHLRDRASEKGRRKELRECVEKLHLLKTPEERRRRLEEIPEIHSDPNMDPSYVSEEEDSEPDNKREVFLRPRGSGFNRRGKESISPGTDYSPKESWSGGSRRNSGNSWELNRNLSNKNFSNKAEDSHLSFETPNDNAWNRDYQQSNNLDNSPSLATESLFSGAASEIKTVPTSLSYPLAESGVAAAAAKLSETDKMWHYKDPAGKVQGPFSIVQLRKWNSTGYFPVDLKIWRVTDRQDDSILLTDALTGKFQDNDRKPDLSSSSLSVEVPKLSADNTGSDYYDSRNNWVNLPSPTPKQSSADSTGEVSPQMGLSSFPGGNRGLQSPAAAAAESGWSTKVSENDPSTSHSGFGAVPRSEQLMTSQSTMAQSHQPFASETAANIQVQSVNSQHPPFASHGWEGTSAPSQNMEPNSSLHPVTGQAPAYGNWGGGVAQNPAGNFSTQGVTALSPTDPWGPPPIQGNQSNMPLPPPNASAWGTIPGNPNMGWVGPVAVNTNMNWGAVTVQGQGPPPGNLHPGWVVPPPTNPGWVAQPTNPGWIAPTGNQNLGGAAQPGWVAPGVNAQGPPAGNPNPGWVTPNGNVQGPPPLPLAGNQRGSKQHHHNGERFSGQRDGGRPWKRQSSFGGGGSSRPPPRGGQRVCQFHENGHCRKGSSCDYLHN